MPCVERSTEKCRMSWQAARRVVSDHVAQASGAGHGNLMCIPTLPEKLPSRAPAGRVHRRGFLSWTRFAISVVILASTAASVAGCGPECESRSESLLREDAPLPDFAGVIHTLSETSRESRALIEVGDRLGFQAANPSHARLVHLLFDLARGHGGQVISSPSGKRIGTRELAQGLLARMLRERAASGCLGGGEAA